MRTRTGSTFEWNPEHLIKLRKNTGMLSRDISEDIGLERGRFNALENGNAKPTVDDLIKMSEYFHVSINYILGMDDEPGDRYPSYEKYIGKGGTPLEKTKGFEAPWPYNLLGEIFDEPIDYIPSEDQTDGLYAMIKTLSEREKTCILLKYEAEKSLDEIGGELSVTRERIRQIIAKGVRKLRHPSRKYYIRYGLNEYENMHRLKEQALKDEWLERNLSHVKDQSNISTEPTIDEMNLSVRAFNCLKRGRCHFLSDVITHIDNGTLIDIRNLGRRSALEIIECVNKMTGSTYVYEDLANNRIHFDKRIGVKK